MSVPRTTVKVSPSTVIDSLTEGMAQVTAIWPEVEAACDKDEEYRSRKFHFDLLHPEKYLDFSCRIRDVDIRSIYEKEYKTWPEDMLFIAIHATEPFPLEGEDMATLRAWADGRKASILKVQLEDLKKFTENRMRRLEADIEKCSANSPPQDPPASSQKEFVYEGEPPSLFGRITGRRHP